MRNASVLFGCAVVSMMLFGCGGRAGGLDSLKPELSIERLEFDGLSPGRDVQWFGLGSRRVDNEALFAWSRDSAIFAVAEVDKAGEFRPETTGTRITAINLDRMEAIAAVHIPRPINTLQTVKHGFLAADYETGQIWVLQPETLEAVRHLEIEDVKAAALDEWDEVFMAAAPGANILLIQLWPNSFAEREGGPYPRNLVVDLEASTWVETQYPKICFQAVFSDLGDSLICRERLRGLDWHTTSTTEISPDSRFTYVCNTALFSLDGTLYACSSPRIRSKFWVSELQMGAYWESLVEVKPEFDFFNPGVLERDLLSGVARKEGFRGFFATVDFEGTTLDQLPLPEFVVADYERTNRWISFDNRWAAFLANHPLENHLVIGSGLVFIR